MKSLEVLKKISNHKCYEKESSCYDKVKDLYQNELENIEQDLERLEEINKVWHDNEPMESVGINGKHLQDLYDYNEELFNKNLELDKKNLDLEKELDIFKLAFYTLWKSTNSSDVSEDKIEDCYIEFRVGYESVCVPVSEKELDNLSKACELLDIYVRTEE